MKQSYDQVQLPVESRTIPGVLASAPPVPRLPSETGATPRARARQQMYAALCWYVAALQNSY